MALQGLRSAFSRSTGDPAKDGAHGAYVRAEDQSPPAPGIAATPYGTPYGSYGRTEGRPVQAPDGAAPAAPIVAGGDGDKFSCPSCGKPVVRGAGRCEGCGQRLVLDVPAGKASSFVGVGALAGFVVGALLFGLILSPAATKPSTSVLASPSAAAPLVPSAAAAALRGTTILNGRIAGEAEPISRALDAKRFVVSDVVRLLRRMSADTRAASAMVPSLEGWSAAADQQAALAGFYADLTAELDDGLSSSVGSAGAYRSTCERVLKILARVSAIDDASRTLAARAGVELPVVVIPEVLQGD